LEETILNTGFNKHFYLNIFVSKLQPMGERLLLAETPVSGISGNFKHHTMQLLATVLLP
jgi:hypothetical protein